MPLYLVKNDITKIKADVIVNSANPHALVGGGVDRAIHVAAGPGLLRAREEIGDIATGDAAITSAFFLPARYVVHTVGPVWRDGKHDEKTLLASCYEKSLRLAVERRCASIAFPLISAGVFHCPPAIAMETATKTIRKFLQAHDLDVYLVIFDQKSFTISDKRFAAVKKYLDERYVEASTGKGREKPPAKPPGKTRESFSEALLRLIEAKGKTDSEIYKCANVDRKHFAKIRNNPQIQPSKAAALAFAVALELNLDETKDFIGRAGYALSHSSKADVIVEYFIENRKYDVFAVNETLFAFDQPLLG